jgi:hypothetical protein
MVCDNSARVKWVAGPTNAKLFRSSQFQIFRSATQSAWIVLELPQPAIAAGAKKAAHVSALVTVVDVNLGFALRLTANGALSPLSFEHRVQVGLRHPVSTGTLQLVKVWIHLAMTTHLRSGVHASALATS